MFLDNIFFPKYRHVKIEKPVFIFGHPRSGTTFLHTILTQTEDFLVFKHWEFNHPSLTIRKFLKLSRWLQTLFLIIDFRLTPHRLKLAIKNRKDVRGGPLQRQKNKLESITQEEEPLFLHILDTQFLPLVTPIGFVERGYPELCLNDEQPHREKSVLFLKNCFKRQIYYTGKKQIIAKLNFSLFRIKTILKVFPDAKIIYISRSPLETIPSHLSLQRRILGRYFGLENIPDDALQLYYKHRYQNNLLFYRHFEEIMDNKIIPEDQLLEISYNSIKNDLWNVVQGIKNFANLQYRPELEDMLKKQDEEQSSYERKHENLPLETFNLTEEKIRTDFDFFFKRYGYNDLHV